MRLRAIRGRVSGDRMVRRIMSGFSTLGILRRFQIPHFRYLSLSGYRHTLTLSLLIVRLIREKPDITSIKPKRLIKWNRPAGSDRKAVCPLIPYWSVRVAFWCPRDEFCVWRFVFWVLRANPPFASFAGLRSRTFTVFFLAVAMLFLTPFLVVGCWVDVSRAEEQLTPARDVPFRDEVIEPDQLFFPAWPLLNGGFTSGRILFLFRRAHLWILLTPFMPEASCGEKLRLPRL